MSIEPPYDATWRAMVAETHALQKNPKCCKGAIVGYDPASLKVQVIPAACGRWDCPDCAPRKAAAYAHRLFLAGPERHITLTWNPAVSDDPQVALARMKKALPKLIEALRLPIRGPDRKITGYTRRIEYAAIWERHKSGFPHLHIAQWGDFIPQAEIRSNWKRLTGASIVYIKAMYASQDHGHNWTKYLLKAIPENSIYFPHTKMVQFSHSYDRVAEAPSPAALGAKALWVYIHRNPADILEALVVAYGAFNEEKDHEDIFTLTRPLPFNIQGIAAPHYFELDKAKRLVAQAEEPVPREFNATATAKELQHAFSFPKTIRNWS